MRIQRGNEYPIPDEERYIDLIVSLFRKTLKEYYPGTSAKRIFHPKMHGLVRAEFTVPDLLDELFQTDLFHPGRTYEALIRFSNARKHPAADKKKDMRGMAIKLFGVKGSKLLEDKQDAVTHDFLLVTSEILQTRSVKDFYKSLKALFGSRLQLFFYAITHLAVIFRSLRQITRCSNLLEMSYFSTTPYRFGKPDIAVKYAVIPQIKKKTTFPDKPASIFSDNSFNKIFQRMIKTLIYGPVSGRPRKDAH